MSDLIKKLVASSRDLSELDLESLRRSVLATHTKAQLVEELCRVIDQRNTLTGLLQEALVKFDAQLQAGCKAPINLMARIRDALSCDAHVQPDLSNPRTVFGPNSASAHLQPKRWVKEQP